MTDELFSVPVVLSPKLAWMQRHSVSRGYCANIEKPWSAWIGDLSKIDDMDGEIGFGDTEDDAIADMARKNGLRLWNEENL